MFIEHRFFDSKFLMAPGFERAYIVSPTIGGICYQLNVNKTRVRSSRFSKKFYS
jgi:hypothetical protein